MLTVIAAAPSGPTKSRNGSVPGSSTAGAMAFTVISCMSHAIAADGSNVHCALSSRSSGEGRPLTPSLDPQFTMRPPSPSCTIGQPVGEYRRLCVGRPSSLGILLGQRPRSTRAPASGWHEEHIQSAQDRHCFVDAAIGIALVVGSRLDPARETAVCREGCLPIGKTDDALAPASASTRPLRAYSGGRSVTTLVFRQAVRSSLCLAYC